MYQPAHISENNNQYRTWLLLFGAALILVIGGSLSLARQSLTTPLNHISQLSQFPLAFAASSEGQTFTAYSRPGKLYFSDSGIDFVLPHSDVRLEFVGANQTAVTGLNQLPGVDNYYLGSDPSDWQIDLTTYAALAYPEIYPGIDLVYDGSEGLLKGTYHVAAGADPGLIGWRYGAETAVLLEQSSGELRLTLPSGAILREKAPIAFQEIDGRQVVVPVQYRLEGNLISFELGAYNRERPLIIQ